MLIRIFSLASIFLLAFIAYHFYPFSEVTSKEVFRSDEEAQTQRAIDNFLNVLEKNKTNYVARGAHSKGHACVKAYFNIQKNIEPELQHGIFSIPGKRYKAWIRFSNGASSMKNNKDTNKDARGMAIKLFNLPEKLIKGNEIKTQEFLMHDNPVFFTKNIEDYNVFTESKNKILYFVSNPNPFKWKLRELKHGLDTLKPPPSSLVNNTYFSNTAYKLGPQNIKFNAAACETEGSIVEDKINNPDFLREELAQRLSKGSACFNFNIQLQDINKNMPIEDPSIEWKEKDSPYFTLAKITIPKQEFNSAEQQAFCENLAFSPWHSLPEHRPIGELNRIRKAVYAASSKYRHEKNKTSIPTKLDW